MLLSFRFGNYRSFRDDTVFSMKASSQTTFNENLIRENGLRVLPSAVVYGSNASGKTNLISAFRTLNVIVRNGRIDAVGELNNLELCPFLYANEERPIFFNIEFMNEGEHFIYELSFLVGKCQRVPRKICVESLSVVRGKSTVNIFYRNADEVSLAKDSKALKVMGNNNVSNLKNIEENINNNFSSNTTNLFLTGGFKSTVCADLADKAIDYMVKKLMVFTNFPISRMHIGIGLDAPVEDRIVMWNKMLDKFIKKADFGPQKIRYVESEKTDTKADMRLNSIYSIDGVDYWIPSELMESQGTIKLIDFLVPFLNLFEMGGTLIVDELDASLHPEVVKGLLMLFNDSTKNINGAQLIFASHNAVFMSNKIFRRDQLFFIEKDKYTFASTLYSLADFGSTEVRNDENYMINYFKGKYSTLPFVDFSTLLGEDFYDKKA